MSAEGYIKFDCRLTIAPPPSEEIIAKINPWRQKLFKAGFIGLYENGIGFGNISIRTSDHEFVISGSATGGLKYLAEEHYTTVVDFDIENNIVYCKGQINASSESMTHGILYRIAPNINSVVHIHNLEMWKRLLHNIPTTREGIEYGTPDMAHEIERLYKETNLKNKKILAMAGHREGIVAFGKDVEEACGVLL